MASGTTSEEQMGELYDWEDPEHPMGTLNAALAHTTTPCRTASYSDVTASFGYAGREYIEKYGATAEDLAEIARINHAHSAANPYSQFQEDYRLGQILKSPMIHAPLTKLQCCPTSDGGAAAVVVSQSFLDQHPHLKSQAIQIVGQQLTTDPPDLFSQSSIDLIGYKMSQMAGEGALAEAGISLQHVQVIEVHDCFSASELCAIDALKLPPTGATGLAQCAELVWYLRGWANNRSVKGTRYCLAHNLGLGGAAVVTVYARADGQVAKPVSDQAVAEIIDLGYNPATEAKGFTVEQARKAVSQKHSSAWALQDVASKVQSRF
ncbi:hypothetical protein VTL71DRAFT_3011 [Oculimacula yallundae]|uniref:Uncharacterized protein n=1 Tax=Oculimacula yallundae TaxID=86028 RepID=A0ABR4C757_9HELO